jgi:hypothetical protein
LNWYESNIDEDIRPIVKLLRDNGFNTKSSCGHMMYVQSALYYNVAPIKIINLLKEKGYKQFKINIEIQFDLLKHQVFHNFVVWFPSKDGKYHYEAQDQLKTVNMEKNWNEDSLE